MIDPKQAEVPGLSQDAIRAAIKPRSHMADIIRETERGLATYFGGTEMLRFMPPLSKKEEPEKYEWRRDRTIDHYENYVEEIVSGYIEGIYRTNQVMRRTDIPELDDYLRGTYDTWVQTDLCPPALYLPEVFIWLEWPVSPVEIRTMQDQKDARAWPRPSFVRPDHIQNLSADQDLNLQWISRCLERDNGRKVYEILDSRYRYIVSESGEVESLDVHGFPGVPVIWRPWRLNQAKRGKIGHAFLSPVIAKSIACLQVLTMLVEAGYQHLALQMVMDPRTAKKAKQTGMGNTTPLEFDGEEGAKPPYYLEKPSMEMKLLMEWAFQILPPSIYRAARMRDRSTTRNISGTSKLFDAIPEFGALTGIANYFQMLDERIVRMMVAAYEGKGLEDVNVQVRYPAQFDLKSASQILQEMQALGEATAKGIPTSRTGVRELLKQAFRALLPDATQEILDQIYLEIGRAIDEPGSGAGEHRNSIHTSKDVHLGAIRDGYSSRELNRLSPATG